MINFDDVMTFSEAAEKWGLADGKTIRKAVERGRFLPQEIKKSGNVWLTTKDAMYRVFGEPRVRKVFLYYRDIIASEHIDQTLQDFFKRALEAVEKGELVAVVESEDHPDRVLYVLKSKQDVEEEQRRLQYFLKYHSNQKGIE